MVLGICQSFSSRRSKANVQKFYANQAFIEECHKEDEDLLNRDHDEHMDETNANKRRSKNWDQWLARITLLVNVIMIMAKIFAAYSSHSMSVISSVVDSAMDITAGGIIWITVSTIERTNHYEYPRGRNRLEPLAIVVVSVIMCVANIIVIVQAAMAAINGTLNPIVDIATLSILCTGTLLKSILFIFCYRHNTPSSRMLALDQRNDVLTNITALAGAYIGHRFWVYADSVGAFVVCSWIVFTWLRTAKEQVPLLIGKAASREFVNRITKIAIGHDERIKCLDTIMVYHLGEKFLVELHVVLDPEMTLQEAHDISEPLQIKLERLPYVEHAFVHCDWKLDGDEHLKKN